MNTPSPISRRTVTAGLAWSVPAVAAVTAAPAFAASVPCPSVDSTGDAIKFPGNSSSTGLRQAYGFEITLTNTTSETIRLSGGSAIVDFTKLQDRQGTVLLYTANPCEGGVLVTSDSDLLLLTPGEKVTLFYVVNETGNSANEAGCIKATFDVALAGGGVPDKEVCGEIVIPPVCFSATPPVGC